MKTNIIWGTSVTIALVLFLFRFSSIDSMRRWTLRERRVVDAVCMNNVPILDHGPKRGATTIGLTWDWKGRTCYVRDQRLPKGPDGRWRVTVGLSPAGDESEAAYFTLEKGAIR